MNKKELAQLKQLAQQLKPVVIIGNNGLTSSVHNEIDHALKSHELIKLRINANDKSHRLTLTNEICSQHQAELINQVGHTIVIYREAPEEDA